MSIQPSRRSRRRAGGKRQNQREAHKAVTKVVELSQRGISPTAIARSTGLTVELVEEISSLAAEVEVDDTDQGEGG